MRGAPSLDTPAAEAAAAADSNIPTSPGPLVSLEDLPWGKGNPSSFWNDRLEELRLLFELKSCERFHDKARNLPYLQENMLNDAIKSLEYLKVANSQVQDYITMSMAEDYRSTLPPLNQLLETQNETEFLASLNELFKYWKIRKDIQQDDWSKLQRFVSTLFRFKTSRPMMLGLLMEFIPPVFLSLYTSLTHNVVNVYEKVNNNTQKVRGQLKVISGLNQADTTRSISRSRSQVPWNEENECENVDGASHHPNKMQRVSMSDPDDDINKFFRHKNYDGFKGGLGISENTLKKLENKVPLINEYYEKIGFAKYESYNDSNDCKTKVRKAVKEIGSCLKDGNISQEQQENFEQQAPCAHNYEVEGTQPWFYHSILETMADCIESFPATSTVTATVTMEPAPSASTSPARKNFRAEALVAQAYRRKYRKADIMLHNQGRYNYKLDGYNMQSMGELKPGSRGNKSPIDLLEEALDQCLSHLAKIVMCGLNFAQAGVTAHATGFIANMAAIQIVQLKLINVGTPDIELVLKKTNYLPLMTKANFENWAQTAKEGKEHASSFDKLKKILYGEDASIQNSGMFISNVGNYSADRVIPMGYIALVELMMKEGNELFGLDINYSTLSKDAITLGAVIGSGSASIVFEHGDNKNHVVKVSRDGATWDIDVELGILKSLRDNDLTNDHIPKLIQGQPLSLSIGGITVKVPAIVTSPRGTGVLEVLKSKTLSSDKEKFLTKVLQGVKDALEFLKTNNIYHCDINPRNIVIVNDDKALLIDFSIALDASKTNERRGFWGTLNYVHREMFQYYPNKTWEKNFYEKVDGAGLYFTMAVLVNGGELPWNQIVGFPQTLNHDSKMDELELVMNERDEGAEKIMKDYNFDHLWCPTNNKSNKEELE